MKFRRRHTPDPEIAPDEIFLDAVNSPDFDRSRFEGRIERPLGSSTFAFIGGVLILFFLILLAGAYRLQVTDGVVYALQSAHNSLDSTTIFAERGVISDSRGVPLVTNASTPEGFVKRVYTTLPGFGALLGYVSYPKKDSSGNYYDTDLKGLAGLESSENDTLSGTDGTMLVEKNVLGTVVSSGTVIPAKDGTSLTLSIDSRAQVALYDAISQLSDRVPFSGGAGVLMDVHTGELRALVSYPSYDSTVMSSGGPSDVILGYANDPRRVYLDRAVQGLYTPGSVVKPIEASGALTDGTIDPNYTINDTGSISVPNPYDASHPNIFVDWKAIGTEDLRRAIAFSSDVYFYIVGGGYGSQKGLGIDRLKYWYDTFGFESPTNIQLPGERTGFVPTPAWKLATYGQAWNIGDTYHTAIGQYAVQITPLEEARAISAIANGGTLVQPTLLEGSGIKSSPLPVNPADLEIVREGMREGVLEGTSIGLSDMSFAQLAGKTGTAQTGSHNQFYNGWAVGFWPYTNPKYVYVVVMEHGPSGNSLGGIYAVHQFLEELHSAAPDYFQ